MDIKKKTIAFDADDTLWINETYYQETEKAFCEILSEYGSKEALSKALFETEMANLEPFGFGAKAFTLSLMETALKVSFGKVSTAKIAEILQLGRALILHDPEVLPSVKEVITSLREHYRLILATKGDLLDQERKLRKSGLEDLFDYVEVMSDKKEEDYSQLLSRLGERPENFLMVGNSVKSDVLPVLNIGAKAVHIPFHTTWAHEKMDADSLKGQNFRALDKMEQLPSVLDGWY